MNMVDIARHLKRNTIVMYLVTFSTAILFSLAVGIFSVQSPLLALALSAAIATAFVVVWIFFKNGKLSIQRIVIPLILVSILLPAIRLPAPIPDVRLELILILVAWTLLLLGALSTGRGVRLKWNPVYKWFFLFGAVIFISIAHAALFKGYYPIGRDFTELIRLLYYLLLFTLVANLSIPLTSIRRYYVFALIVLLGSALFGFSQYLNLGNINTYISPYFTGEAQMRGLIYARRITGTLPNPNDFGALMVLASSLALSGVLFFRRKTLRLFSWVCLPIFGLAVVLTLSRTALVALGVAVFFMFLMLYPRIVEFRWVSRRMLTALPIVVVIVLLVMQLAPDMFFVRVAELRDIEEAAGWQMRLIMWQYNFDLFLQSPVFGWGPVEEGMPTIVDNEWLLLLRRYGIVGVAVFVALFASLFIGLSKIRRASSSVDVSMLTVALQATIVAYAIFMIPAGVYHSLRLMPILLLFLGLAYSQAQKRAPGAPKGSQP